MPELLKGLAVDGLVAGSLSHSLIFWLEPISGNYQPLLGGNRQVSKVSESVTL